MFKNLSASNFLAKSSEIRQETMEQIANICEVRTEQLDHRVYLCGGFREGQVCPEHLWLEDHTTGRTYDTFIDQDVRVVARVGQANHAFQPGCEATPFHSDEIARVQKNGYTTKQLSSLPGDQIAADPGQNYRTI